MNVFEKIPRGILFVSLLFAKIAAASEILVDFGTDWSYFKGAGEATTPAEVWRSANFSDASWELQKTPLRQGVGTSGTLLLDMPGNYSCVFLRQRFEVLDVKALPALILTINYDAGFVAWINGVEAARSNAPATLEFNGVAPADHPSGIAETFPVQANAIVKGVNVIAIQAFSRSLNASAFMINARLSVDNANGSVAAPTFSKTRSINSQPFDLTIASSTPGAVIRYTIDGSIPSSSAGIEYTAPIQIPATTILRAVAYKEGMVSSRVKTQTYIFVDDVVNQSPQGQKPTTGGNWPNPPQVGSQILDYGMDPNIVNSAAYGPTIRTDLTTIPAISIVMDMPDLFDPVKGIYANPGGQGNAWERPGSIEVIDPGGNTTREFQIDCGIRIRGGFSRIGTNPKHSFHFYFNKQYGESNLDFQFIKNKPTTYFKQIDLRCEQGYSWHSSNGDARCTFIRDVFSRDCQQDMGRPNEGGDFYFLYLNGQFWGMFNTAERCEASFGETYFGGDKDEYDCVKQNPGQYSIIATDGNLDAYARLWTICKGGLANNADYFRLQGKDPQGNHAPEFENLLDVENMIDYMLVIYYTGNADGPITSDGNRINNYFGLRSRRGQVGFRFFCHDCEATLMNASDNRTGPYNAGNTFDKANPQWFFQQCTANTEFKVLLADHVQKHFYNGGALTPQKCAERFNHRKAEVDRAVVGESARWGDAKVEPPFNRDGSWVTACNNVLNGFFPTRSDVVLNQFRTKGWLTSVSAPAFSQYGGDITPGFILTINNSNGGGTLYYTTDGSDPRLVGGQPSPTAQSSTTAATNISLDTTTTVRARIFFNNNWSGIQESTFSGTQDLSKLKITEVMHHPVTLVRAENTGLIGQYYGDTTLTELKLVRSDPAISFSYDLGPPDSALPTQRWSVRWTGTITPQFSETYTLYTTSDDGVRLFLNDQPVIDNWVSHATTEDSATFAMTQGVPVNVRMEYYQLIGYGSVSLSWSSPSTPKQIIPQTALSGGGLNLQDGSDDLEFVEIKNTGDVPLNLTGVSFTSGITYEFPEGSVIPAHGFKVVASHIQKFLTQYPSIQPDGPYLGQLNNAGERLALSFGATEIFSVKYGDGPPWPATADGLGFSIVPVDPKLPGNPDDATNWRASTNSGGSPGADDPARPALAAVVIAEVLTNSVLPAVDYIKLHNPSAQPAGIGGWFLSDSPGTPKKFRIADGTTILPNDYVSFDEASINPQPGVDPSFSLSSDGDSVHLFAADAAGNLTGYSHGFSFDAADTGVPFGAYKISTGEIQHPALSSQTPAGPNALPKVGPIVIAEIMYEPATGAEEFIELKNITDQPVKLFDPDNLANTWKLSGVEFTFSQSIEIPARGFIILTNADATAFRQKHNIAAQTQIFTYAGVLKDGGETLRVEKPGVPHYDANGLPALPYITIDAVDYADSAPWPTGADGTGYSIERTSSGAYGNDPINWRRGELAGGSPGYMPVRSKASFVSAAHDINEDVTSVTIAVQLDFAADEPITIHYETVDASAPASDFQSASGDLTFAPGEKNKTIEITLSAANALDEDDRGFGVELSANPPTLIGAQALAIVTIVDDDDPPALVAPALTTITVAGATSIAVSLAAPSGKTISVDYQTVAGTAVAGTHFTAASGTLAFIAGETNATIPLSILSGYNRTFSVTFSNPVNLALPLPDSAVKITISNPPVISSGPNALPNPALVGQSVAFSCVAAGNGPFTFEWNFGDGQTQSAAASVAHAYTAAGTFTTSVMATDADGLSIVGTVVVEIQELDDGDTDDDGYTDVAEQTLGTNPNNPDSKPGGTADFDNDGIKDDMDTDDDNDLLTDSEEIALGTNGYDSSSLVRHPLVIAKIAGALKPGGGKDSFSVSGTIANVPATQALANQTVVVRLGGADVSFILDAKGKGRAANGSLALKFKPALQKGSPNGTFPGGLVTFSAKARNGSWAAAWADEGVNLDADAKKQITMTVDVRLASRVYGSSASCAYTAKKGKSAGFKK